MGVQQGLKLDRLSHLGRTSGMLEERKAGVQVDCMCLEQQQAGQGQGSRCPELEV